MRRKPEVRRGWLLFRHARAFGTGGPGVLRPADVGVHMGRCFAAYPQLNAQSADRLILSPETIKKSVIPQMNAVLRRFHQNGLLLRDICPEHLFFHQNAIAYCGFSNLAALRGQATATGEPGYGQETPFLAPEAKRNVFTFASDYYAFGVTLLRLLRNPDYADGVLPPASVTRLRDTWRELYTSEDEILYLIRGLTLPDPNARWGWEETRVWMNGHMIPWTAPDGTRLSYDFTDPFVIDGAACWRGRSPTPLRHGRKKASIKFCRL